MRLSSSINMGGLAPAVPPAIVPASLPNGQVGSAYSFTFSAVGGTQPYKAWAYSPAVPGLIMNSSTGVLSGTPTTVGTYNFTVSMQDFYSIPAAPVGFSLTVNPAPAPPANTLGTDPFPRIAQLPYFTSLYNSTGFVNWAGKFQIVVTNWYIGVEPLPGSAGYSTLAQVHAQQKAVGALNGIASRPVLYAAIHEAKIPPASSSQPKFAATVNANTWWLLAGPYPSGGIIAGDAANMGVINVGAGGPIDAGTGKTVTQYGAYYFYNVLTQGNATSLFGEASNIAANPNLAGLFWDAQFWAPRGTNGGWPVNMTGTWTWGVTIAFNTYATTAPIYQNGEKDLINNCRSLAPAGFLLIGNSDVGNAVAGWPVTVSGQANLYDCILAEAAIGASYSWENTSVTPSQTVLNAIIDGEAVIIASGGSQIVQQVGRGRISGANQTWTVPTGTATNQASWWVAADWQAQRYGLSLTMMRNCHYALADYNSGNSVYWWSDDFDAGGTAAPGWLGQPTDPPQSAVQNAFGVTGIYVRRFQYGIAICNPKGNGSVTLSLPSGYYWTLPSTGLSDAAVNTNTQVNTVTLNDGDGRILANQQFPVATVFISPTGSDSNSGALNSPWSSSKISTIAPGTVVGFLPGTYTSSTLAGNYNSYINANGATPPGHTIPANLVMISCNAAGKYQPRTVIFESGAASANPFTGFINPIRGTSGGFFNTASDGWTIDGFVIQNYNDTAIGCNNNNNHKILNCDIKNAMTAQTASNPGGISISPPGGNGTLIYNTYVHNLQVLPVLNIVVSGATSGATHVTLVSINGVATTTWPFDTRNAGHQMGLKFTDTGQEFSTNVVATFGSGTITLPSAVGTTSNGSGTFYFGGGGSPTSKINYPWGCFGIYMEGVGTTTPIVIEGVTNIKTSGIAIKTTQGAQQWLRTYSEQANFANNAGIAGTFIAAQGFFPPAGKTSSADHCIIVGWLYGFGEGADGGNDNQLISGTVSLNHCTFHTPYSSGTGWRPVVTLGIAQATPGTVQFNNNAFGSIGPTFDTRFGWWGSLTASPVWGTYTGDHNLFPASWIARWNGPGSIPETWLSGTTNFSGGIATGPNDWRVLTGQDTNSKDPGSVGVYVTTPASGNVSTFQLLATAGGVAISTLSSTGGYPGAIDGTYGRNGMPCGVNFWY